MGSQRQNVSALLNSNRTLGEHNITKYEKVTFCDFWHFDFGQGKKNQHCVFQNGILLNFPLKRNDFFPFNLDCIASVCAN